MKIFILILVLLYLPIRGETPQQEPRIVFQRISSEDGLSQDSVTSIIPDQTGFIWVGTIDGLNRFDGYNFTIFRHEPTNPNSLSDNWIRTVIEGKDGTIWAGTNHGLNQINPKTGKISQYLHDPQDPSSLSSSNVLSLYEDRHGDLWVGTTRGLDLMNRTTGTFTRMNTHTLTFPDGQDKRNFTQCRSIFEHESGKLLLISGQIYEVDIKARQASLFIKKYPAVSFLNDTVISKIFRSRSGDYWIALLNNGVIKLNLTSGKYKHYQKHRGEKNCLSHNSVISIYESPSGVIWLGTSHGGINRYVASIDGFITYSYDEENPNSLGGDSVNTIFQDETGTLWMGIYGQGITKMIQEKKIFTPVSHYIDDTNSLSNPSVQSFYVDRSGTLWVGTAGGLNRWDPQKNGFTHFIHNRRDPSSICNDTVRAIYEDKNKQLWLGTAHGLDLFDQEQEKFIHFKHDANDPRSLSNDLVRAFFQDRAGDLWIGTGNGLNRFDYHGKKFTRFLQNQRTTTIDPNSHVTSILGGKPDFLWIGTLGGGLKRYNSKTGQSTSFQYNPHDHQSISDNNVIYLHEDRKGQLWIGTKYGLNKMDRDNHTFIHYFADEFGLPNNTIYGILDDEEGNLWLSTNRGLSRFNPDTMTVRNYYVSDGLQNNEFNGNACYRSKKGKFYFGGVKGYNAFFPAKIIEDVTPSKLVFLSFLVVGEKDSRIQPASKTNTIKLSHRKRNFTVEFSSLDFRSPEKNHYAYMLENFNEEWNYIGNRHYASYTNLDPGEYYFRVKGTNNSGIWSKDPISLKIIVSPPFWKTWWFISLSVFAVIFTVVALYRWRLGQLEKHKKKLEDLVEYRTSELINSNKQLEKLSLVVRETDNAVLITDDKGDLIWVNEGFTRMYDATLEQLIEERGRNIADSSKSPDIQKKINICINERKTVNYESSYVKSNGEIIWTQTSLTPHFDADGRLANLVAIDSDITKIKEAEEAADKANRSKGEFLARMSHEILTPMNGIMGFSETLLNSGLNEDQMDHARTIHRSGEALIFLLNDILDFSKLHTDELTLKNITFDPEVTVFDVCDVTLPRLKGKDVEIFCEIEDNVPAYVKGDAARFRQVLVNLMANAAKFTACGEIKIVLNARDKDIGKIELVTKISDTGKGIPRDKINSIFDVFEQADVTSTRKYGFPGLGLYICKKISSLMGGDILVQSEVGKGSTFTFICQMEKSDKTVQSDFAEDTFAGRRILVVDERKENQDIIARILIPNQVEVTRLLNVDEVIPTIQQAADTDRPYELCIVDTQIRDNSGYQLAQEIRHLPAPASSLKLLALTSPLVANSSKCRESGYDGFLPKPVQKKTLLKMIEKLLGKRAEKSRQDQGGELVTQHTIVEDNKHATRILLVDDNPINLKLAKFILEKAGYRVTAAKNGQVAVETFVSSPQDFDLIFMDIQMPVMNGRDATRKIREAGFKEIPIVAMTAETMEGDKEKCLDAGMNDYIPKPIKREAVFKIIKKWCFEK